ncbi:hypothetical protein VQH23_11860 [Pararoseomonas sp. SCSIO 73927]|uniref:hypothetical protein n=1 Tax=Pararoseomonas sp. SCSIO 73927 TaxID=3114537 RepID=UPI0030CCF764
MSGGTETNPILASNISDADFAAALRQSLSTHAMLASAGGTFRLEAKLVELERPSIGFSFEVKARVAYRLVRVADGREVFSTEIRSAHTATFSDAAYGVERLRIANEGAARENVRQFLVALVAAEKANPETFGPVSRPVA